MLDQEWSQVDRSKYQRVYNYKNIKEQGRSGSMMDLRFCKYGGGYGKQRDLMSMFNHEFIKMEAWNTKLHFQINRAKLIYFCLWTVRKATEDTRYGKRRYKSPIKDYNKENTWS